MTILLIYISLLTIMLVVLWRAGILLQKNYKILSVAGISAIVVYTLNEGLRFGRGIDYNVYWDIFEQISSGWHIDKDFLFMLFTKALVNIGIPYQGQVLIMSFMFIVGTLFLLKSYKEIASYALPLFVLFSLYHVENMVRWYLGYSFVLIGLYYLLNEKDNGGLYKYLIFSVIAFLIHYALLPIPILFYLLSLRKTPLFRPITTLILFFGIYFLFETKYMLKLTNAVEYFSSFFSLSEGYSANAEYWLTGGFAGIELSGEISKAELVVLSLFVIFGYKCIKAKPDKKYIFAYNVFIIGLLMYPISLKIELMTRFTQVFFFFRAIILSVIIVYILQKKVHIQKFIIILFAAFLIKDVGSKYFLRPFKSNPQKYLYVWNKRNQNQYSMLNLWLDEDYKNQYKKEK